MKHANPKRIGNPRSRRGFQLLELVVGMTSASLLVSGIATSIFLATRGREIAIESHQASTINQSGTERLRADLAEAKSFASLSATAATFTVEDRDGDAVDEILQYSWGGAGTPLRYSAGDGQWRDVTENLNNFQFDSQATAPQSSNTPLAFTPIGQFTYLSHTMANAGIGGFFNSDSGTDLTINLPSTYEAGHLLVIAIVVENQQDDSISTNASWTKIAERDSGLGLSLAVFYSYSPSGNSASIVWDNVGRSHAIATHFRPYAAGSSLDQFAIGEGTASSAPAPASIASAANSLVLRIIGTDQTVVPEEATNMPGHVPIAFRSRTFSAPSIGMAMRSYPSAGTIPQADFGLTANSDFVSATLVFSP